MCAGLGFECVHNLHNNWSPSNSPGKGGDEVTKLEQKLRGPQS